MAVSPDPYRTLGVSRSASDAEVRAAYRRLAQLHHPDHNGGSAESARRFELVQDAYARVRTMRESTARASATRPTSTDPQFDARLAKMEAELKAARDAREKAARKAEREARYAAQRAARESFEQSRLKDRPSDEELGYISTDDSFSSILDDFAGQVSSRLSGAREQPVTHKLADLLDDVSAKLRGEDEKAGD